MAGITSTSLSYQILLALLLLCNTIVFSESREFKIPKSWAKASSANLSSWSGQNRFNVGDKLNLKLSSDESVALVSSINYRNCISSNAIEVYNSSSGIVELDKSGPYYFISTEATACSKAGKKVEVVVISPRGGGHRASSPAASPYNSAVTPSSLDNKAAGPPMAARTSNGRKLKIGGIVGAVGGILLVLVF